MRIHKINSKKQDNGLWGMPINVESIKMNCGLQDSDKHLLISALIVKFDEIYNKQVKLAIYDTYIDYWLDGKLKYRTPYDEHILVGDTLYWLETEDEKKEVNRMLKLNKLIQSCGFGK